MTRRFGLAALFAMMICRPAEAPATIAEQRARLPPAAECAHPVEGKWKGKTYYHQHRNWYEFDLEIRRVDGSDRELTGTIRVHFWDGVPEETEPGDKCDGRRIKIVQPASGSFEDGKVTFGGTSWDVEAEICGAAGGYIVDTFSGTFEPDRQEFQSKNDWVDGGVHYSEPTVFRRVGCFDEAGPIKSTDTRSPAFYPKHTKPPAKKSAGGC